MGLGVVAWASKEEAPGVTRALRFWVMVSSTVPREMRRKSSRLGISVSA